MHSSQLESPKSSFVPVFNVACNAVSGVCGHAKTATVHVWDVATTACCRGLSACVQCMSLMMTLSVVQHTPMQLQYLVISDTGRISPQQ